MSRNRLILLVVAVVLIVFGYWVHTHLVWREVHIPSLPKGEVLTNDLFAAQRLLTGFGANAVSSKGFQAVPQGDPKHAVLVFPTTRKTLTLRQRQRLLDWVDAGGHLVVVTYTLEDEGDQPDLLLVSFGVHQKMKAPEKKADDEANEKSDAEPPQARRPPQRPAPKGPNPRRRSFSGFGFDTNPNCPEQKESGSGAARFPAATLKVCFDPQFRLTSDNPPLWSVEDADGIHALTLARGQGRVTVMTDYGFMKNTEIGQADHADFLLALLGPDISGLNVQLIPREEVDSLRTLIWRYGWMVVLCLLLLIAAVLWRDGARFGPLEPQPVPVRRSLMEHVRAGGEFLWRRDQARTLWQSTLNAARRRITRAIPTARSHEQLVQQLAAKTGIDAERISQALTPVSYPGADEFLRAIATLELMRKKL